MNALDGVIFDTRTLKKYIIVTLSGAPDHVVSWSDFSLQHKKVRKLYRICHTIFSSFYRICLLTTCWSSVNAGPLWLLSYKQQSLAFSNTCYLLWSHVEYRIVFIIIVIIMQMIGETANKHTYKNKKGEEKQMDVNVIPNNMEKYMAFMLSKHLVVNDSLQFMSSSLNKLVNNLQMMPLNILLKKLEMIKN